MKKLVPIIRALCLEHKMGFKVDLHFEPYYVHIKVLVSEPRDLESNYDVQVGIRNSLIEKSELLAVQRMCDEDYVILDDLRDKILKILKEQVFIPHGPGMSIKEFFKDSEKRNAEHQIMMNEYKEQANLTDRELSELHMFFSPSRVVAGLTPQEVRLCIMLRSFRETQMEGYPIMALPRVHPSLMEDFDKKLPRAEGLKNTLYELFIELANRRPPEVL